MKIGNSKVGILFSVFDGDQKHFDRFLAELERLKLHFAVNFDHCSLPTLHRFMSHPYYLEGYVNDDPKKPFDESHRQTALDILYKHNFDYAFSMDVDETLEKNALDRIEEMIALKVDVVTTRVLDLWKTDEEGDLYYRIDGPFKESQREKLFWLKSDAGRFKYYHATSHAPHIKPASREVLVARWSSIEKLLRVLHWGIMDQRDVVDHTKRWDDIYTKAVGANPYGFYPYINDPQTYPPELVAVPSDV